MRKQSDFKTKYIKIAKLILIVCIVLCVMSILAFVLALGKSLPQIPGIILAFCGFFVAMGGIYGTYNYLHGIGASKREDLSPPLQCTTCKYLRRNSVYKNTSGEYSCSRIFAYTERKKENCDKYSSIEEE